MAYVCSVGNMPLRATTEAETCAKRIRGRRREPSQIVIPVDRETGGRAGSASRRIPGPLPSPRRLRREVQSTAVHGTVVVSEKDEARPRGGTPHREDSAGPPSGGAGGGSQRSSTDGGRARRLLAESRRGPPRTDTTASGPADRTRTSRVPQEEERLEREALGKLRNVAPRAPSRNVTRAAWRALRRSERRHDGAYRFRRPGLDRIKEPGRRERMIPRRPARVIGSSGHRGGRQSRIPNFQTVRDR